MNDEITFHDRHSDTTLAHIKDYEHIKIRDLLLGHRVEKIAYDHMRLDDGTLVLIDPNEGCGGCVSGGYELDDLNGCDNIITAVDFETEDSDGEDGTVYRVNFRGATMTPNAIATNWADLAAPRSELSKREVQRASTAAATRAALEEIGASDE